MIHEEVPVCLLTSDNSSDFSFFLFNSTFSDLKIVIGNEEIAVHKAILCKRSQYFADVLLKNPEKEILSFQEFDIVVFKEFLRFLYSDVSNFDSLDLKLILKLIEIGKKFSVTALESALLDNLEKHLTVEMCCQWLNIAINSKKKRLTKKILAFMDENFEDICNGDFFNILSQEAMIRLLNRKDLVIPEIKKFEFVQKWRQGNDDVDNLVAKCIKVSRFTKHELLTVGRCEFIDRNEIFDILSEIEGDNLVGQPDEIPDQNLACSDFDAKITSTTKIENVLSNNSNSISLITDGESFITVELKTVFNFNHIQLYLGYAECSYYIEVSQDNKKWQRIIDYNEYVCHSEQNLFFETVSAKFVKIIGTKSTHNKLYLHFVKVYLMEEIPQVVNGVTRPMENIATLANKAIVSASNNPDILLNEEENQQRRKYTSHSIREGNILIQLAQPYLISSARLLLYGDFEYRYLVETSFNGKDWEVAVDKRNKDCRGWQNWEFDERVVVFIRITGTDSTCSDALETRKILPYDRKLFSSRVP